MRKIPVACVSLNGNESKYVLDCLEGTWISSIGKYITLFEQEFAKFCGVKHAVATNNGTTALHLALVACGIGPGDEVLIPTVTYIATANAVRYCGAEPILADVVPETLNIDVSNLRHRITSKTKAIIAVHLYGHPVEMGPLLALAEEFGLIVIEDAAEAHGAEYLGRRVGSFGKCSSFSFFGNKILTTGEGGMVTTDDDDLAEKLRLFRGQGVDPKRRYWFEVVGYNYRMTNIQAAIGLAQIEQIDSFLTARQLLASRYDIALAHLSDALVLPQKSPWARQVYWMYTVYLRDGGEIERNKCMELLAERGIETRPVFYPMHVLPPYAQQSSFPTSDKWACRGINLPTHLLVSQQDVEYIADALKEALVAL